MMASKKSQPKKLPSKNPQSKRVSKPKKKCVHEGCTKYSFGKGQLCKTHGNSLSNKKESKRQMLKSFTFHLFTMSPPSTPKMIRIKLNHCAFPENAAVKAVKFAAISSQDTKHEVRDDTLISFASHDVTQAEASMLTTIGEKEIMNDSASKVDSEDEKEEEDIICHGFNNYLGAEDEQSAFNMAHSLSGMSQEYIVELLKHLKASGIGGPLAEFINWKKLDRVCDSTDSPEYTLRQDDGALYASTNLDRLLRLYGATGKPVTGAKVMRNVVRQVKAHRGALTPYQRAPDHLKAPINRPLLDRAHKRRIETGIADCQRIWGQRVIGMRTEATLRQAFNFLAKDVVRPSFPWPSIQTWYEATVVVLHTDKDVCMALFQPYMEDFLEELEQAMRKAEEDVTQEILHKQKDEIFYDMNGYYVSNKEGFHDDFIKL